MQGARIVVIGNEIGVSKPAGKNWNGQYGLWLPRFLLNPIARLANVLILSPNTHLSGRLTTLPDFRCGST